MLSDVKSTDTKPENAKSDVKPVTDTSAQQQPQLEQPKAKLDTDALLLPLQSAKDQLDALEDVIEANTAAFKEIKFDLSKCNSQEKTQAVMNKVIQAIADLSIDSQKVPSWVRERDRAHMVVIGPGAPPAYGQYPVNQPLNRDNPVPWPPGYSPSGSASDSNQLHQQQGKAKEGEK